MKDAEQIIASCTAGIEQLESNPEFQFSLDAYKALRNSYMTDSDWWDQTYRAMTSVVLNVAEGIGRSRGYQANFYLNARGSAYEVYAALLIGPRELKEAVAPALRTAIKAIEKAIIEMAG